MSSILGSLLIAVCLGEVKGDLHHNRYNYSFTEFVCSEENLGVPLDCSALEEVFRLRECTPPDKWREMISPGLENNLQEVYDTCCDEA